MARIKILDTVFPFIILAFINITNHTVVLRQATAEAFLNTNLCVLWSVWFKHARFVCEDQQLTDTEVYKLS